MVTVYTVEGSEDGLILATTSKRKALEYACGYVGDPEQYKPASKEIAELKKEYSKSVIFLETNAPFLQATVTYWEQ